jgi:1-aminocyclopropane-1-carboxylate deaminase/D-cysteine desulfhydrase-like pyridoxal-dependent ACC family enzyme
MKEVAATEGILLDPVYIGRAMAGMLTMTRNCELSQSKNVLFCYTAVGETSFKIDF